MANRVFTILGPSEIVGETGVFHKSEDPIPVAGVFHAFIFHAVTI
jgi:hypothetical protein